ncbi:MAG TPA: prepilin-type N-terminal cleavage/methylation domain-containing protein [Candidatus Brocadiales bacterium]|nr:prepilin-type N-terminal cleavage/methylation domain-containing protein [Candidatus Brocadiales bacterium]
MRYQRAFTLIEVLIVLAIIAILAGILTPVTMSYIEGARIVRAQNDVEAIGKAILSFNEDTALWPIYEHSENLESYYSVLYGSGALPSEIVDFADRLENQLNSNIPNYLTTGEFAWNGPYLSSLNADPWGNSYVVNSSGLIPSSTKAVWVISAGPNGIIDTSLSQERGIAVLSGDDIGYRIK